MASSYVSCSVQKISKCTRQISFGWWGAVSVLCGKPGGVQLKYSKRAAETSPARRYLVVHHRSQPPSLLQEAKSLIWTLTGVVNPATITVGVKHEASIRGGAAVRQGHLATIKDAVGSLGITDVILNFSTTASHMSRISQALQPTSDSSKRKTVPVIVKDRTGVVLDIFRKHASSAEAHLQVKLAELRYQASRVVRRRDEQGRLVFGIAGQESEVVSARGRGGQGAVGGAGEKEAVVVAARSRANIARVVQQLQEVRKRRGLLRAQRRRDGHAVVALVGYTNAGKSTLMSALCKEDVGAADKLFATLDTKVRRTEMMQGQPFLVVDTVGFIQGLPLQLVAAFQATLDEALQADLVVHVIDASSPSALQQRRTVLGVLAQLGMSEHCLRTKMIEVWNKADCLIPDEDEGSDAYAHLKGSACGSDEEQMKLWQLVQNHLYRETHQARRPKPSPQQESSLSRQLQPENSAGMPHLKSSTDEYDVQNRSRHPAEQELEIESESDSSSEHRMEMVLDAESSNWSASSCIQDSTDREEQCTIVERDDDSWDGSDAEQDYNESSTDEPDSFRVGLQEPWSQHSSEGERAEWVTDSAVVVAAKDGLGLARLTDVITKKLQQDTQSSRV